MTNRVQLKDDVDLTGQQFGRLLVLERSDDIVDSNGKHNAAWLCECQCDSKTIIQVRHHHLINKNTKSCGCLSKEHIIEYNKLNKNKYNTYDLTGDYGIGWTTNTNDEFYFDLEDYDKIKNYCWRTKNGDGNYKRVVTNINTDKAIPLHFIITGSKRNVDHENRNTFDNRKSNLREATCQQNSQNRTIQSNNTSGIIGVHWNSKINKWISRISVEKNKRIVVYRGDVFEEAIQCRLKAEKEYYGEFAPQKHLYKQYGIA